MHSWFLRLLTCVLLWPFTLAAEDWPQFLGPRRDGSYSGPPLAEGSPQPVHLWKTSIGEGFSGPVVQGGKLILFHRQADLERIDCLDATNGRPIWSASYPTRYRDDFGFDEGPRATPAILEKSVYTFGADGMLACWELDSGEARWKVDTLVKYKSDKGFFGRVCSPLVERGLVLMNLGGDNGAGLVGFDAATGEEKWRAGNDKASYSSPVTGSFDGRRYAFFLTRNALVCLDPDNGAIQFQHPFRPGIQASVTAATPLIVGRRVFVSASYDTGALVLEFDPVAPKVRWNKDDVLSNHYATAVPHRDYLYGYDGRQEYGCNFRCVELDTGKVRWSQDRFGAGTVILANDTLLLLTERGELIRAPASPESFKPSPPLQILGFDTRAHPALANGLFYARDKKQLVCVDLRR